MLYQPLAEVFPVHELLADELDARGWMLADLARALDVSEAFAARLLSGDQPLTIELAAQLGKAMGTSAEFWLNLQALYIRNSAQ